jgi:hypothetical protein
VRVAKNELIQSTQPIQFNVLKYKKDYNIYNIFNIMLSLVQQVATRSAWEHASPRMRAPKRLDIVSQSFRMIRIRLDDTTRDDLRAELPYPGQLTVAPSLGD